MNFDIETLNRWGGQFLDFAWPMLWQSSLLIAMIFVLDFAFRRKIRAAIRYTLWLVLLLKLILPPALALPTSAAWWLRTPPQPDKKPPATSYVVTYGNQTMPGLPITQPPVSAVQPPPPTLSFAAWTLMISSLVGFGLFAWMLFRWQQVALKIRWASDSDEFNSLLDDCRHLAGLRSAVELKLTEDSMSPAVCGLFRPVILLPQSLVKKLSAGQLRAVLLHEAIHLRRGDVWVNCAQALMQIVYWWHPLLWLANARIRRVREEAVDDAVMLDLRDDAEIYAPTLLEVAKLAFNRPLASLGLVGILESRSALRQRIERLVNFHAPRKAGLTVASILGILAFSAVALPMGQAPEQTNESKASLQNNSPNLANGPSDVFMAHVGTNTVIGTLSDRISDDDRTNANSHATNLEMRVFKVDPHTFPVRFLGSPTNGVPTNGFSPKNLSKKLGVDLTAPGRSVAYNDGLGLLLVRAKSSELDTIERIVQALNQTAPQIHIKTRFIEVPESEVGAILQAGTAVDTNTVEIIAADKMKSLLRQLESTSGVETLAEPEAVTISSRQVQVRSDNSTVDLVPTLLMDAYTLNLLTIVSKPETRTAQVNVWDGQTLALVFPDSDGKSRLVIFITSWIVDPAGNRVHSDDELRQMQEKAKSDIPPQHTLILSDPNFRAKLHTLEQRTGVENLAEPESVTTAGRGANRINRIVVPDKIDISTLTTNAEESAILAQDGKMLYEIGKFDDAEAKLKAALASNPDNQAAHYYMNLVQAAKAGRHTQDVHTGSGREMIYRKLNSLRLKSVSWPDGQPLSEVIRYLAEQSRLLDPEQKGIHFLFNPNMAASGTAGLTEKPALGAANTVDPSAINVKLMTNNVSLHDALDAVVLAADRPIKYSIEDYAVVISPKPLGPEPPMLEMRVFKVDTNAFASGLRGVRNLQTNDIVTMAKNLFSSLGVDLSAPGRSIAINDRLGLLFVRATPSELDTVERVIQALNQIPPQIHIKARFIEVPKKSFVAMPQLFSNAVAGPMTGILSDSQFRTVLQALEHQKGVETQGEPEAVVTTGRQVQMRVTQITEVVTNIAFRETSSPVVQTMKVDAGTMVDVVPYVLSDGYTISLTAIPSAIALLGYEHSTQPIYVTNSTGRRVKLTDAQPGLRIQQGLASVNLWDNQTLVLGNLTNNFAGFSEGRAITRESQFFLDLEKKQGTTDKKLLVFITATIVDPAGNRVHSDEEMRQIQEKTKSHSPPQPNISTPSR